MGGLGLPPLSPPSYLTDQRAVCQGDALANVLNGPLRNDTPKEGVAHQWSVRYNEGVGRQRMPDTHPP
jgi:hypothetical protein